jgi:hypothetical protein
VQVIALVLIALMMSGSLAMAVRLAGAAASSVPEWSAELLAGWLVDWSGWLVGPLVGWHWSVGWLALLVGWLVALSVLWLSSLVKAIAPCCGDRAIYNCYRAMGADGYHPIVLAVPLLSALLYYPRWLCVWLC